MTASTTPAKIMSFTRAARILWKARVETRECNSREYLEARIITGVDRAGAIQERWEVVQMDLRSILKWLAERPI